jgi:hypothetical protein
MVYAWPSRISCRLSLRIKGIWLLIAAIALVSAVVVMFILPGASSYKRRAPAKVPPVRIASVEYRAPNRVESQGIVEAWDVNTGRLLWTKRVYRVFFIPFVEGDTQWVFIKTLEIGPDPETLVVVNESGRKYVITTQPPYSTVATSLLALASLLLAAIVSIVVAKKWKSARQPKQS